MPHRTLGNHHVLLALAVCLALGCSKADRLGCGGGTKATSGEGGGTELKMSSKLPGVYKVTRYQQSQDTCDQLVDIPETPGHLVLYHFQPNDGSATRLGGAFCGEPNLCRAIGKRAVEPAIGYSFLGGDDATGWQGWAILDTGNLEGKCAATVQSHALSVSAPGTIQVETKTVKVYFVPASEEDGVATCSNKQAIAVASQDKSCKSRLMLQATREADL